MKTTTSLLTLASSIAIPALAAAFIAHGAFFTEILFGSYAIAGLLAIAANDYSPRQSFAFPQTTRKARRSWTRLALTRQARSIRALRTARTPA